MDTTPDRPAAHLGALVRARIAVSATFFIFGCGASLWAVHIPIVAERLGMDHGMVALVLFTMAVGAVGMMPLTGWVLGRIGSHRPATILAFVFVVFTPIPILSPTLPFLFVAVLLFGASMGALDVAMNIQASEVETARRRPTMSFFHGFYSVGTLAGAALGGLLIGAGLGGGAGAVLVAAGLFIIAAWDSMNLWTGGNPIEKAHGFTLPPVALLGLGGIVFLTFAAEGAVMDWSALYLSTVKESGAALAASGVVVFSIAMLVCRLAGDAIVERVGARNTILGGGWLMAAGIIVSIMAPSPLLSAVGFGILGAGAANIVPVAISAAARVPGVHAGIGVASVTTMGYAGFLFVPPILGFVARAWGLSVALSLVVVMGLVVSALAGSMKR